MKSKPQSRSFAEDEAFGDETLESRSHLVKRTDRLKFWQKEEEDTTLDLDRQIAKMSELNEANLKVYRVDQNRMAEGDKAIDLEREFMQEIAMKKKPKVFKILMFAILVILVVVVLIVIIVKLK